MRAKLGRLAGRLALGVVGLVIGAVMVSALREATLSTHQQVAPDSEIEVIVRARSRNTESGQALVEHVEAQLLTCRLEVASDLVGDIQPQAGREFRAVLSPSMDETNRRQFRGCVEDFMVDGLQMDVLRMEDVA